MATNQNDQNITELPIKTNTGVASTDYMLGIDSAEGYQILVRDVAKYIVENYNGSSIIGSAQTVKSAFDALNSKLAQTSFSRFTANASGVSVNIPTNYRGMLATFDSSADRMGLYFVYRSSSAAGKVNVVTIRAATALIFDAETAGIFTITSPGTTGCIFWNVGGTAT